MKKYILVGSIISLITVTFTWFIPLLNILVFYLLMFPLILVSWLLNKSDVWVRYEMFGSTPVGEGWYVFILSIVLIGCLSGYLVYQLRRWSYGRKGLPVPELNFSGFFMIFVFQIFILLSLVLIFAEKIQLHQSRQREAEEQKYLAENCQRIEEEGKHYYACPDQVIVDINSVKFSK